MFDLGIVNGSVYLGGRFDEVNLYVRDGKIAAVTKAFHKAKEEYDAGGRMVLPGLIDPHVHFSMRTKYGFTADSFFSGTTAGIYGGVTTVIDFLDCAPDAAGIEKAFESRMEQAQHCVTDYAFHASVSNPADSAQNMMRETKKLGIATIKLYTTYKESNSFTPDVFIDELLKNSAEEKVRILVHAENDAMLKKTGVPVAEHANARPAAAETSEVINLAEIARYRGGLLYIVHVSAGSTLEALEQSFADQIGKNILIESCPHYFTFTSDVYSGPRGNLYTMAPPLRSFEEQELLKRRFNRIDTIGTDHCSFLKEEKQAEFTEDIPMGVGGIESSFKVMYGLFGNSVIDKFTLNVAKAHGLYPRKGTLQPGSDADIVIFDDKKKTPADGRHSACDYSIYEGMTAKGSIDCTILRGKFVLKDGVLCRSQGRYIKAKIE